MSIFKPAIIYFALVFAAGFLLGTIRVLWLAPALGERAAELSEMPLMLIASFLAARLTVSRWGETRAAALAFGIIALGILLAAEFTVVLGMRGLTLSEYFAERDPVSGTAYAVSLLIFGLMPFLLFHRYRKS